MEDKENPAGCYEQLTSQDEATEDELSLPSNQEQQGTENPQWNIYIEHSDSKTVHLLLCCRLLNHVL